MPNYGAWEAIANSAGQGISDIGASMLAARKMQAERAKAQQEAALNEAKTNWYGNKAAGLAPALPGQAITGMTPDGEPVGPSPIEKLMQGITPGGAQPAGGGPVQGPMAPGQTEIPAGPGEGPSADFLKSFPPEVLAAIVPKAPPGAPAPSADNGGFRPPHPGETLDVYNKLRGAWEAENQKAASREKLKGIAAPAKAGASSSTGGFSRGEAALFGKYFSTQDSNKISSVPNALKLHNAMLDLNDAYLTAQGGDPNRAWSMLKQKAANNDFLRSQIGGIGNNPNNIIPVYNAARRAAAVELYKITTGSQAAPSDEAVKDNEKQYPDLGMPREQAQPLFDLATETQIMPAIQGAKGKIQLNKDTVTGKYSSAELEKLARSLEQMEADAQKNVHRMTGAGPESIVPGAAPDRKAQIAAIVAAHAKK